MTRNSLVWRLIGLTGGVFAVTALAVFVLVDSHVRTVIQDRAREVYAERVAGVLRRLEHQAGRLQLTGQPDVYEAGFQESVLRELDDLLLQDEDQAIYPFILGEQGQVLLHPEREAGDTLADEYSVDEVRDAAPIQFIGSGATINDATDNAFERAGTLFGMTEGEVRARCTFTGGVEIARLPGVVQLSMLAPMDLLEECDLEETVRNHYDL